MEKLSSEGSPTQDEATRQLVEDWELFQISRVFGQPLKDRLLDVIQSANSLLEVLDPDNPYD